MKIIRQPFLFIRACPPQAAVGSSAVPLPLHSKKHLPDGMHFFERLGRSGLPQFRRRGAYILNKGQPRSISEHIFRKTSTKYTADKNFSPAPCLERLRRCYTPSRKLTPFQSPAKIPLLPAPICLLSALVKHNCRRLCHIQTFNRTLPSFFSFPCKRNYNQLIAVLLYFLRNTVFFITKNNNHRFSFP